MVVLATESTPILETVWRSFALAKLFDIFNFGATLARLLGYNSIHVRPPKSCITAQAMTVALGHNTFYPIIIPQTNAASYLFFHFFSTYW
jgi:hypothetical protein